MDEETRLKLDDVRTKLYAINSWISVNYIGLRKEIKISDIEELNNQIAQIIKKIDELHNEDFLK